MSQTQEFYLEDVIKLTDYLKEDCIKKNLITSKKFLVSMYFWGIKNL